MLGPPETAEHRATAWPRWAAGLVIASVGSFVVGLALLPGTTSLDDPGTGCTHLVSETPIPFILFGFASLALVALPLKMASARGAGEAGNGALAALLLLTLMMGLLLQAATSGGIFFVFIFVLSAIIYLPLIWIVIRDRSNFSEVYRAVGSAVLALAFVYPWLAYAVAPHPVVSC